jgi:hypothetical protein
MTNYKRLYLIIALSLWIANAASAQDQVPAPAFKEGDTWQINITRRDQVGTTTAQNEGTYELVFTEGKVKVFQIDGNQKTELDVKPDTPAEGLLGLVGRNERRPDLKFPLSIGQKWNYQLTIRPAGGRFDQRRSAEVTVVGTEQVTTPAGSFKAYKLVRSESWSAGPRSTAVNSATSTFFYSPETRSIVKRVTEASNSPGMVTNELIKFTSGN